MPVIPHTIRCLSLRVIAPDVYEVVFTKPEGFSFRAGQFVLFDVPLIENRDDIQTRAFSIASAPSEAALLFVIKLVPHGRASRWIAELLHEGTEVTMRGPFGMFVLDPATQKPFVLVATGAGIAPFRAYILDAIDRGDRRRIDVLFCVRTQADFFWIEDIEALARKHGNLGLHVTLSHPSADWNGLTGRVQAVLPDLVSDFMAVTLYACGNPEMTKDVKRLALTQWGMEKKDVHVEGYI